MTPFLFASGIENSDPTSFFEQHAVRGHCILGTDYYRSNEHHVDADGTLRPADELLGYAMIAGECQRRYGLPMVGFTWYSLTDQVDWDIELREQRGVVNPRGLERTDGG
jgi:hypothetical protein